MPAWQTDGNRDADVDANSFLGTRANDPLRIRTRATLNNADAIVITAAPNATTTGNVGIGTATPENAEEWNKVLDILGADAGGSKLSVRTASVNAQVWAASGDWWGAPAGMAVGTLSFHPLSFATGGSSKMTIDLAGRVGIGTTALTDRLTVEGRVKSNSGGFVFPDGSVQTTAMPTRKMGAGRTTPGAGWQQYQFAVPNRVGNVYHGIFIDVNTQPAQFRPGSTPVYVTSIGGNSLHWDTTGGSSVYQPTPTGFRVYVKWRDGRPMTVADAQNNGWHINWVGFE